MAVRVEQSHRIGDWDKDGISTRWIVYCGEGDTIEQVRDALDPSKGVVPGVFLGIGLDDIRIERETEWLYFATAIYRPPQTENDGRFREDGASGEYVLEFDTGSERQHITTAKETAAFAPQGKAVDQKIVNGKVIGWDGQRVNGVDIVVGQYQFTEQWDLPGNTVTVGYRKMLSELTGKVNNAQFRGFAEGEVLFLGANGRRVSREAFSMTFRFAVSPNAANITVGEITVPSKEGWQYLDVMMADTAGDEAIVQVPRQTNVHKVYDKANFALLHIGTADV